MITQVYEIQTAKEAAAVAALGIDHIGSVIVSQNSWKQPEVKKAIEASARAGAKSSLILLYHDIDDVMAALDYYQPDMVHFCEILVGSGGREILRDQCRDFVRLQAEVKNRCPAIMVMRSLPVPDRPAPVSFPVFDLMRWFEPVSDYFLIDSYILGKTSDAGQPVKGFVGITGRTCDWHTAARMVKNSRLPVILAGGLSPENVYEAVMNVRPAGVDSCTRTNAVDGSGKPIRFKKNLSRVQKFAAEARRAAADLADARNISQKDEMI